MLLVKEYFHAQTPFFLHFLNLILIFESEIEKPIAEISKTKQTFENRRELGQKVHICSATNKFCRIRFLTHQTEINKPQVNWPLLASNLLWICLHLSQSLKVELDAPGRPHGRMIQLY